MTAQALLDTLALRGVQLMLDGTGLVAKPASKLTDADREAIRTYKAELVRLLAHKNDGAAAKPTPEGHAARNEPYLADRIEATWKPGEWLAYRDGGDLLTAKYAGISTDGVNVWLADGAVRSVPFEAVAPDWSPDGAEIFEERLSIMLASGVPEEEARSRAEECTREYLERLRVLQ